MNENDSQKMELFLQAEGFAPSGDLNQADVIVINTCSVRDKSYQKAVSTIGRAFRKNAVSDAQKPVVAVTGCVASHDGQSLLKRFPFIDIILGPDHISRLPSLVKEARLKKSSVAFTDFADISDYEFPSPILWKTFETRKVTSYVTIMKGCDNVCSFCIVPFVRGREVSRPSFDILEEIHRLEAQGIREVTLLGQNVNSYAPKEKTSFAELLRLVDENTKLARIRYTSPHPKDLSKELIEEYGRNSRLCPHIHLPVQSGSSRVLKRMRRSYTKDAYLRKIDRLRKVNPQIAITTDIIVGFPTETDKDFQETLELVREVGFDAGYSFVYSSRPNTEAASFKDDVPENLKRERLQTLQDLQAEISLKKNRSRIGGVEGVLVEGSSRDGGVQLTGHTPSGLIVNFVGDVKSVGDILNVEITSASPYSLRGKLRC